MTTYEGQCHCGQTTWTAIIPEEKHILCHCTACKILGGGEYTLNQIIPKDNFKSVNGTLNKYTYKGDSGLGLVKILKGKSVDCFYCPNCTAHAYHFSHANDDMIVIHTTPLTGTDKWGKPAAEIYGSQKLDWQPQTADAIFDTTPSS